MKDKYGIYVWNSGEQEILPEFMEVFASVFKTEELKNHKYFTWKHLENPQGESIVTYARDLEKGKLAAVRCLWKFKINWNGKTYTAYQPCDTATHPDYQRQGLFTKLTRLAMDQARNNDAQFLFNFPNFNSRPGNLKLGWLDENNMTLLLKPANPLKVGMTLLAKYKNIRGSEFEAVHKNNNIGSKEELPENIDNYLVIRSKLKSVIMGERSKEILRWRFFRHPVNRYEILSFSNGIAFLQLGKRGDLSECKVVEIFFSSETLSQEQQVKDLSNQIKKQYGTDLISLVISQHHPYHDAFRRSGFYHVPAHITMFKYSYPDTSRDLLNIPWGICGADIDTQ